MTMISTKLIEKLQNTVPGTFTDIDILEVDGWGISAGDIV